ncbi:PP2C family protein-serine/threonine phosphatase [Parvibium lacunae]|uniref:Response regulatory domain-containing protein n=1 Tax=Parvibium lacunae TaxID=1888893 RepID=A0A368L8A8_9BURK|nr:fused response regulator/phosphatase [Parvibium lacunae]RCS59866.1 hypothetical protein DU000_04015 [Parvibium lacunae]
MPLESGVSKRPTLLLLTNNSIVSHSVAHYCQQKDCWLDQLADVGMLSAALQQHRPWLIVLDLDVTGSQFAQLIQSIKQSDSMDLIPIILVGPAYMQSQIVPAALHAGANFYLETPQEAATFAALLSATLETALRHRRAMLQLFDQVAELESLQQEQEEEKALANNIINDGLTIDPKLASDIQRWVAPAQRFSGDLIMAEMAPDHSYRVILADGVGHGLPAALTVLPLVRTFRTMARAGYGVRSIVYELNRVIRETLPHHRFVAVSLLHIDPQQRTLECWNGGNPPVLVYDEYGEEVWRCRSSHLPLGILETEQVDLSTDAYLYHSELYAFLCSDGLPELTGQNKQALGMNEIEMLLKRSDPEEWISAIQSLSTDHLQGMAAHDDISVAAVRCRTVVNQSVPEAISSPVPVQHLRTTTTTLPVATEITADALVSPLPRADLAGLDRAQAIEHMAFAIRMPVADILARDLLPLARRILRQIGPVYEHDPLLLQGLQVLFGQVAATLQTLQIGTDNIATGPAADKKLALPIAVNVKQHLMAGQQYVGMAAQQVGLGVRILSWETASAVEIEVTHTGAAFADSVALRETLLMSGLDPEHLLLDTAGTQAVLLIPLPQQEATEE